MIKQVCLYCKKVLGSIHEDEVAQERISHGVCPDCFPTFVAGTGTSFADFLDAFPVPIFVFGLQGRALGANALGRSLIAKEQPELLARPAGEVFACAHAEVEGGCGETMHCKSCTIRNSIQETLRSGRPNLRVPAYMDLGDKIGQRSVRHLISTELAGQVLLLRIDDVEPEQK